MKHVKMISVLSCLGVAILCVNCAKTPDEKVASARAAITAAKNAGAEKYATTEFESAKTLLNKAVDNIQHEQKYLGLFSKYDYINKQLDSVVFLTEIAIETAKMEKERLRIEKEKAIAAEKKKTGITKKTLKRAKVK
jgi:photosystem II stability/assembly factor-like uncharacterized protein